jgi:hypothetical protein
MSKDSEIRRMSLLKSSGVSPISLLNLSLEILKVNAQEITVNGLFATAGQIYTQLPDLKRSVDSLNLSTAKELEKWVVSNGIPVPDPAAETSFEDMPPLGALPDPAESAKKAPPAREDKPASTPVEKTGNVIVGEVSAVSRNQKGVKIGDVWYNVTTKTVKTVEPAKGKTIRMTYVQGNSGLLVEKIEAA